MKELLRDAVSVMETWWARFPQDMSASDREVVARMQEEIDALRAAIDAPEQEPPLGSKWAAAMAIYQPPFVFKHGYVFDSKNNMVADQGGFGDRNTVERSVALQIRGWGRIGYMPNAAELQDEVGAMCVDALNAYYSREVKP